jgi:hypothetical protein
MADMSSFLGRLFIGDLVLVSLAPHIEVCRRVTASASG